jgi:hypothetical protein
MRARQAMAAALQALLTAAEMPVAYPACGSERLHRHDT